MRFPAQCLSASTVVFLQCFLFAQGSEDNEGFLRGTDLLKGQGLGPTDLQESPTNENSMKTSSGNEKVQGKTRRLADDPFEGLLEPQEHWLFRETVPNALDPEFTSGGNGNIVAKICQTNNHEAGIYDSSDNKLKTPIYGYGLSGNEIECSWPGATFYAKKGTPKTVTWQNKLPIGKGHILTDKGGTQSVVDESLHWAYSLEGLDVYTLKDHGVPAVSHLHGGHTASHFDGNPEFFFGGHGDKIKGPYYEDKRHTYENDQDAALLWYHDHALGLTRLNVYAGLAGFYVLRDGHDTGIRGNPLGLPTFPYEAAFAIQDRMFKENGELFYPAFEGDPAYDDFITEEGATLPPDFGATALAEFFGNYMVVNGKIWPKMNVEQRMYRLRLLNGCDSRFLVLEFYKVGQGATSPDGGTKVPFHVIGSDQGLGPAKLIYQLVMETGARYDLLVDFGKAKFDEGDRIIMANRGGDEPFGGDIPGTQEFWYTDRIMAFDVQGLPAQEEETINWGLLNGLGIESISNDENKIRRVGLFEGFDEHGRLQPLLGTVDPNANGVPGGTRAWFQNITENPALGAVEDWEIWNFSEDAHPIHLHLVYFEVLGRYEIDYNNVQLTERGQPQHNGTDGIGYDVIFKGSAADAVGSLVYANKDKNKDGPYAEKGYRKDIVAALPGQVTKIRVKFDKTGRYVWHCHILSHEDHEMMRVFHVGEGCSDCEDA